MSVNPLEESISPGITEFDRQPNLDQIAQLLMISFRFSQGNPQLHDNLIFYLRILHPNTAYTIPQAQLKQALLGKVGGFLKPSTDYLYSHDKPTQDPQAVIHTPWFNSGTKYRIDPPQGYQTDLKTGHMDSGGLPLTEGNIENEVSNRVGTFVNAFSPPREKEWTTRMKTYYLGRVAKGIIDQDYRFLCQSGGRPRALTRESQGNSPITDPWLSHYVFYGLEGHDTGYLDFNQIFGDCVSYIKNPPKTTDIEEMVDMYKVKAVERVYLEKHNLNS